MKEQIMCPVCGNPIHPNRAIWRCPYCENVINLKEEGLLNEKEIRQIERKHRNARFIDRTSSNGK